MTQAEKELKSTRAKRYYETMPPEKKQALLERTRKNYKEGQEKVKARRQRIKDEAKEFILSYKMNHPCEHCGETNPIVLDFHHVDPTEKDYAIGNLIGSCFSVERVAKEVYKCIVLCANCHRIEHHRMKQ